MNGKIDSQLIHIQGYNIYRLDRQTKNSGATKRGGGLLIYAKSLLDVYVQEAESISSPDLEVQWIKIKRNKAKDIVMANLYRPPLGNVGKALKVLGQSLESVVNGKDEVLIIGDFNVDYQNQSSLNYKKLKFFEKANSLEQKIGTTTRNTKTSKTLLDIALTNIKYIRAAGPLDSFLSDHQPIFILKKKTRDTRKLEQVFEGRSYRKYDKQQFIDNLAAREWVPFYEAIDPTSAWDEMHKIIEEEADKMCPVRKYKIKNSKPPWLVNELIEQMKDRDYFYAKAKKRNNDDDWNIAKFHRNQVILTLGKQRRTL